MGIRLEQTRRSGLCEDLGAETITHDAHHTNIAGDLVVIPLGVPPSGPTSLGVPAVSFMRIK
jgi:hypothetical protein